MLTTTDDADLAAQALRGDREALGRLLERHYDRVYRIAYRYLGSAADAEDVAQNVCVALATRLAQFRGGGRFTTWLTSIAINACRDHLRRRKSAQGLSERYVALREMEAADQADSESRSEWLRDALASLDPTLRETVILVVAEELSHADAAKILGCAESTISWRMHVAKERLRAVMDEADG